MSVEIKPAELSEDADRGVYGWDIYANGRHVRILDWGDGDIWGWELDAQGAPIDYVGRTYGRIGMLSAQTMVLIELGVIDG